MLRDNKKYRIEVGYRQQKAYPENSQSIILQTCIKLLINNTEQNNNKNFKLYCDCDALSDFTIIS